ncbi:MAG: YjdF family protein [Eggerthella lenta]
MPALHANPKRRQREARKLVERAGVGTKAQQAMSVSYEARKIESRALAREARQAQAERRFALRRQKRSRSIAEGRGPESSFSLDALRGVPLPALRRERSCEGTRAGGRFASLPVYIRGNIFHARYTQSKRPKRARQKGG